ncbi:hypothetical protein [Nocardiopsis halotolerans]|uniref:hypothetical protein n=1 Tax=Nocardiopsis halotolerans TaxID=124252 RepID=UPI0003486D13|nr:hypothetical protein [Nocardiopsis halotolerans]
MLLISLMLRHRALILQRLLGRLRIVFLSLGFVPWPETGHRWVGQVTPLVLCAFGVGLTAAVLTVAAWFLVRAPTETGRTRWPQVSVFVMSVVFSLTLGSMMVWTLAVDA